MISPGVGARNLKISDVLVKEQIRQLESRKQARQEYDRLVGDFHPDRAPRLIIVANRLPVVLKKEEDGEYSMGRPAGGLVSALSGLNWTGEMLWVGWPGTEVDESQKAAVQEKLQTQSCYPVFLTTELEKLYYNGFCNNKIWPLFHYVTPPIPSVTDNDAEEWDAYRKANETFAEVVATIATEEDFVWVQDYHLMLVPQLLRQRIPDGIIGWFLHTPWPTSEVFRMLPSRDAILQGLLSANVVGFHVYDYCRHFLSAVVQLTACEISPRGVNATVLGGSFVLRDDSHRHQPVGVRQRGKGAGGVGLRQEFEGAVGRSEGNPGYRPPRLHEGYSAQAEGLRCVP
jgi:trehalose-6-phosphate synthase